VGLPRVTAKMMKGNAIRTAGTRIIGSAENYPAKHEPHPYNPLK
jgi:hypothetical protein